MKASEIATLAREFSKEHDDSTIAYQAAKDVINFLLRRYCLVEKSKVKQIYQAKQHILANQNVFGITVATEAAAQKRLMLCLFPEIAKEVES